MKTKKNIGSIEYGAFIAEVSEDRFETAFRMIKSEPAIDVKDEDVTRKDGWSVVMKDKEDVKKCVIALGQRRLVTGFGVDTSYFSFEKFSISIEGTTDRKEWKTLIEPTEIKGNKEFKIDPHVICTHIRLSGHSNGGIARFHVYGESNSLLSPHTILAMPLTSEAYVPYGEVIDPEGAKSKNEANQGSAYKYNHVAKVSNLFPLGDGKSNLCVFRCKPTKQLPFTVKLLERHPYSTQAFIPMTSGGTRGYLVVVALNGVDDYPDMTSLKAFIATSNQGVSYRQGVWHHPMIALDCTTDFAVLVHENGVPEDDCNVVDVPHITVQIPGFQVNL